MTKYADVSASDFPLIRVTFTGEAPTVENFTFYLQEVKESYNQQQKIVLLFDATKAVFPGTNFQKQQADWIKENTVLMRTYCLGTAYVIPNILIRNVLKAIFAFQKQPVPYTISSTAVEAENWLQNQFK